MLHGTVGFVMIVWLSGQSEKPQHFAGKSAVPVAESETAQNDELDRQALHPILKLARSSPRSNMRPRRPSPKSAWERQRKG
jgi:hypothetical protein